MAWFVNAQTGKPISWQVRVALAMVAVLGLGLLAISRTLEPDPRGFGTHEQLGLTPCYFHELTGLVCPMCGSTTAWALVSQGAWTQAAVVNLAATLLCLVVMLAIPLLLVVAISGRWLWVQPSSWWLMMLGSAWLVVVVLDWLRRIYPTL